MTNESSDRTSSDNTTAHHRVLLVEDNKDDVEIVKAYLKGSSIGLTVARDGIQGLQAFKCASYDLVLMDIEMPLLDGFAATSAIRHWEIQHSLPITPITALTASSTPRNLARFVVSGFSNHLSKPVTKASLLEAVMQVLDASPERVAA